MFLHNILNMTTIQMLVVHRKATGKECEQVNTNHILNFTRIYLIIYFHPVMNPTFSPAKLKEVIKT